LFFFALKSDPIKEGVFLSHCRTSQLVDKRALG
jgi:hypothetical protein